MPPVSPSRQIIIYDGWLYIKRISFREINISLRAPKIARFTNVYRGAAIIDIKYGTVIHASVSAADEIKYFPVRAKP